MPAAQVQRDGQVGGCKEEQVGAAAARRHAGECEARVAVQQREERVEEAQLLVRVRLRVGVRLRVRVRVASEAPSERSFLATVTVSTWVRLGVRVGVGVGVGVGAGLGVGLGVGLKRLHLVRGRAGAYSFR